MSLMINLRSCRWPFCQLRLKIPQQKGVHVTQFLAGGEGGVGTLSVIRLHCSQTDLMTGLQMVCNLKFVHYGHNEKKKALYVLLCLSFTTIQSPRSPIFKKQNLEIGWLSSSGSKICFGSRTKSSEAIGLIFWKLVLNL